MAYLGLQPNTPLLNTSTQTFSGNSVATQFTLARSVATASDLDVMIGSTMQRPFADYVAGNISLQFTSPPTTGSNNITVTYRAGALNSLDLTVNTFNAGTVAAPGVVSLAANNTGIYWANASSMSVTVSGTNRATFASNPNATTTDTGALQVNGGIGVDGNAIIGGNVVIGDTTESTSISTGAFKVSGGAGIVGNLNIGGDITCVGDFTVNGTFTTTGTDSLQVTDPFIFLANNNPGDTYDSGVISQYFDGANTRYTGYFRDVTDARYKLFTNLLTQPTTTVDTTDPSFEYTDLLLANLSASGNVTGTYFIGNGSALTGISTTTSNIFNANTSVAIAAVNANVNMVVNGTQIANVWSGGISVVGGLAASTTISATGNIIGGNVQTAGVITATGNITSAGNVSAGNILTGGNVSSVGTVIGGNIVGTTSVSSSGSVVGASLRTNGIVSAAGDVYGDNFNAATNVNATVDISATANVIGGNILTGGDVSAAGNINGLNINGTIYGNINATIVSASGNVTGGNLNAGAGNISTTGNVLGGNLIATALVQAATLSASGAVTFSATTQNISIGASQTTGNITIGGTAGTGFIAIGGSTTGRTVYLANGVTGTGNTKTVSVGENGAAGSTTLINIGPATATTAAGTVTFNTATVVAVANTSGTALSVAGNIVGANINTSGSGGNITGANVISSTSFTATANVVGGNIVTAAAMSAASVSASSTVIAVGNITGGNILTGGLMSSTGNITGGNILTAGLVSSTGNITSAANVAGGNVLATNMVQGNIVSATSNVIATANVSGAYFLGTGISLSGNIISGISTTANITGSNIIATAAMSAASVSASGNITGGNVTTAGQVTVSGIYGNVVTNQFASVWASGAGANPYSIMQVRASDGVSGLGMQAYTGSGTLYGNTNIIFALGTIRDKDVPASLVTKAYIDSTGLSVTGNITGGNIIGIVDAGSNTITTTGDITGGNIIGIVAAGANAITTTGNVSFGNLISTGFITINSGNAATAILNAGGNGVGNIGSSANYFNTGFLKATTAQYADLAEYYAADAEYPPGTVLSFGGVNELTITTIANDTRVAGVVSTNPAHAMNAGIEAEHSVALALSGRVPTMVIGEVRKGDMMVSAGNGRAQACATPVIGTVIGKAVQDHSGGQGTIEVVVGRL